MSKSTHVTEIMMDMDKMPEWAQRGIEDGNLFSVAFERVSVAEAKIDAIGDLVNSIADENNEPPELVNNDSISIYCKKIKAIIEESK